MLAQIFQMDMSRSSKSQVLYNPVSLKFKDPALENRFASVQRAMQPHLFQIGLGFLVLMYMVLAISQISLVDASLASNLGYAFLGVFALLSFSCSDGIRSNQKYRKFLAPLTIIIFGGVLFVGLLPGTHPQLHMTAILVTLTWFWLLSGLIFFTASLAGWAAICAYIVALLNSSAALSANSILVLTMVLLSAVFVTLTAYIYERRLRIDFSYSQRQLPVASPPYPVKNQANTGKAASVAQPPVSGQVDWAKSLKQMTIELAGIRDTEIMYSRMLEHIKKIVFFDAAAVGKVINGRIVPLMMRDQLADNETIRLLWSSSLINDLQKTRDINVGEADVGLLETSIHGGELSFGYRLDIPFFSQQKLNGVVTLLRKRPPFNEFEMNLVSSMVFHGMFAQRSARLQAAMEKISKKRTVVKQPPSQAVQPVSPAKKGGFKVLTADEFIEQAEVTFRRLQAGGQPVSLLLVELDRHEYFIDMYGRNGKEKIFEAVAGVLHTCAVDRGLLGTYGKGSFAIQLPMGLALAKDMAENMRQTIEKSVLMVDGYKTNVTVSIGVSCLSKSTLDFLSVLRCADLGLFMARDAKGNTVRVNV